MQDCLKSYTQYFQKVTATMANIQAFKDLIPEFVVKLYHILEKNEFQEFISWANDGTEILIRNPKKLEDKVLPHFFRHRHLSSFIRQLNMYKFNKVNKISKERSHMYFKNEHFQRGSIEQMKMIKRNQKHKKGQKAAETVEPDSLSIQVKCLESDFAEFKEDSNARFAEIQKILEGILEKNPNLKKDLLPALKICEAKTNIKSFLTSCAENSVADFFPLLNPYERENKDMMGTTARDLQALMMNSLIMPSICSLTNLEC